MAGRVLVVEDHSSVRAFLRVLLEGEGYRVTEATGGLEAVATAEEVKPSLILLDLMMPGLDGERVLSLLEEKDETKDIPVIVVTAKEEAIERVAGRLGAENVFRKPFEDQELLAQVAKHAGPPEPASKSPYKG